VGSSPGEVGDRAPQLVPHRHRGCCAAASCSGAEHCHQDLPASRCIGGNWTAVVWCCNSIENDRNVVLPGCSVRGAIPGLPLCQHAQLLPACYVSHAHFCCVHAMSVMHTLRWALPCCTVDDPSHRRQVGTSRGPLLVLIAHHGAGCHLLRNRCSCCLAARTLA
jgi:hypothetical protein